jgi:hypothetical protein
VAEAKETASVRFNDMGASVLETVAVHLIGQCCPNRSMLSNRSSAN